jgi:hypothetical protein
MNLNSDPQAWWEMISGGRQGASNLPTAGQQGQSSRFQQWANGAQRSPRPAGGNRRMADMLRNQWGSGEGALFGAQPAQPAQTTQPQGAGENSFMHYYNDIANASPTGQAAGNNATASGINSTAQGVAQGLGVAGGLAGLGLGAPGITGIGMAINALGLNELNVPDMQINNELSTNNVAQDVAGIQSAMDNHSVGMDAMSTAAAAVADGSSGGSSSAAGEGGVSGGGSASGDGTSGEAGGVGAGDGGGGTYRKGGYIKRDGDKKLEARKVTAHEGEFVIRPEAVDAIGIELLRRLNARK